jgi:uncharacterized protein YggE
MRMLSIAIAILLALPGIAAAQYKPERGATIAVKGKGFVTRKPELARFNVTLTTSGDTLKAASDTHKARLPQAATAMGKLGEGAAVESSSFRVTRDFPAQAANPRSKPKFEATTTYSIEVSDLKRLDAVVKGLLDSGLFELSALYFAVNDPRAAVNEARERAVGDARQRATSLAKAADVTLGEVLDITDDEAYPEPRAYEEAADLPAESMEIIPPETLSFSGSVDMTWRIAPR